MSRRILSPFLAGLFLLGALALPARAQACGLITFGFTTTGPGCAPVIGMPPVLTGALLPSPALTVCPVRFTLTPSGPIPLPGPPPGLLVIGASDPMLDLTPAGLPGCVLRASLDALLVMGPSPASPVAQIATVTVPMTPALVGVSAYAQGLLLLPAVGALAPQISNGLRVDIT